MKLVKGPNGCWDLPHMIVPFCNPSVVTDNEFRGVVHGGNIQSRGKIQVRQLVSDA